MNYSEAYTKALRYGRAPAEDIAHWAEQSIKNGSLDGNNSSDGPFADLLNDHSDPREEIVRRDMSYRRPSGAAVKGTITNSEREKNQLHFDQKVTADAIKKFGKKSGPTSHALTLEHDDGRLDISPYVDDNLNIVGHQVSWFPKLSNGRVAFQGGYLGNFLPEEFDTLMAGLGEKHTTDSLQKQIKPLKSKD